MKRFLSVFYVLILVASCRNNPPGPAQETVTRVRTAAIVSETISIPIHTSGILAASEEMRLSFKAGGIVAAVSVREGEKVRKDHVLAELNLSEIRAGVNIAEKGYEKALRDWERAKNLYADTVATLEQYQNASTALEIAKSNFEIAAFNLRHSTIKAPADGIILKQLIKENELISPGYPVFFFGVTGENWKVKSGLSDRDVVRVNVGDSASVTFDAWPGVTFPAVIEQIGGISNPLTGTYETEIRINGSGYRLAAGFIAGVDIFPARNLTVFRIPVEAIVDADGETGYVYTVDENNIAAKTGIKIVSIAGSAAISGLPTDVKEIVTEGAAYLKDGMKVEVVK